MNKQELITKYEITLKTIREVISNSELNEDTLTAQGCARFVKGFLEDLRGLEQAVDHNEMFKAELPSRDEAEDKCEPLWRPQLKECTSRHSFYSGAMAMYNWIKNELTKPI